MGDWTWVGAQALSSKSGMLGWLLKTWSSKNFPTSLQPSRVSVFSPLLYWDQVPLGSAGWSWTFSNPLTSASWVLALWRELACATLCGPLLIITSWLQMGQHFDMGSCLCDRKASPLWSNRAGTVQLCHKVQAFNWEAYGTKIYG